MADFMAACTCGVVESAIYRPSAPAVSTRSEKRSVTDSSIPMSSTSSTSSPPFTTDSPVGTKPPPSRRIEITSDPSGRARSRTAVPSATDPAATSISMISSCSRLRSSRCTRPYLGTSCSISRRIRSVADTAGLIPSSSKCWRLRGLLQRATTLSTPYFSPAIWQMRMLSSSSPVTAITRSARSMPARSRIHSSVPSPYWIECSSSSSTVSYRRRLASTTVTSLPLSLSSRARFQPTLPAPTISAYISRSSARIVPVLAKTCGRQAGASPVEERPLAADPLEPHLPAHRGLEQLDRRLGGAHGLQSLLGVPPGATRVEHTHNHAVHLEAALGDLGDHQVGVVAVG